MDANIFATGRLLTCGEERGGAEGFWQRIRRIFRLTLSKIDCRVFSSVERQSWGGSAYSEAIYIYSKSYWLIVYTEKDGISGDIMGFLYNMESP